MNFDWAHTGISGLDKILQGLRKGDNVVWQINELDAYAYFVDCFVKRALKDEKRVVYFRFAEHEALLNMENSDIKVYKLNADNGFESFAARIHNIITDEGKGTYYVFDCLSDLLLSWATDLMIGNFFVVVCPYLYELDTIAYFGIIRDKHSHKTIARIQETTQLLLDLYQEKGEYYLHPVKVWNRYSPTMFLPHLKKEQEFIPITSSFQASNLFSNILDYNQKDSRRNLDYWDRLFLDVSELQEDDSDEKERDCMIDKISRLMLAKDEKTIKMIKRYFRIEDLLKINSRLIGTGFIGGKSLGMLMARNILENNKYVNWHKYSEEHDSFFVGSDVFYTYIVQNGWWKLRLKQKTSEGYYVMAQDLKEKLLTGKFPDEIKDQFHNMLDYFGQSPIIIRSSSLLEDGYGNAFAGKYDSVFCVNQGSPEERYQQFLEAVRQVYASTMNRDALTYRQKRGLDQKDEQMALLIQRVSGSYHNQYFFPDAAGVGISYNTFAWNKKLDPEAGLLRIVFGLGTRAVDRVEGDYPRIVALDNIKLQAYGNKEDSRKYSQHKCDLLDIEKNCIQVKSISTLLAGNIDIPQIKLFGYKDKEIIRRMQQKAIKEKEPWIIDFNSLLEETEFATIMQQILNILEEAYDYPVDIEFTLNITNDCDIRINLLQCRPLQTRGRENKVRFDKKLASRNLLFKSKGNFMGGSFIQPIKRVIYVRAENYNKLIQREKYDIARLIGKLNNLQKNQSEIPVMLIGPGRWGTTTPSLGVPISFSEINHVSILMEVAYSSGNLVPELSFGSHFFQDLVETDIFYIALFPEEKDVVFKEEFLLEQENKLLNLIPGCNKYQDVIHVCDIEDELIVTSDLTTQEISG
ncbi:MAG: PEP/pyruvate-binding domain-containing protein [Bacillota bacterium]